MMWGAGWDNWIVGLLMMVLFWGGLVLLVVLAMRGSDAKRPPDGRTQDQPDARSILEERFAKGEISEDEFEDRRRVLEHSAR
jgi:putative membrane protein